MQAPRLDHLPPLRENPFNGRPLEKDEHHMLGGRDQEISLLSSQIRQRSPRLILLKGARGSGRTSFIHAVAALAERHHSFTMFPESNHVSRLLDETYSMLVGFDRPEHTTAMVDQMVRSLASNPGPLQMLSFDFPSVDGQTAKSVFSRLTPVLRRLKALIIITASVEQAQCFPDELLEEFDSVIELQPLDHEGLRQVIEKRIASVSRRPWGASEELLDEVHEATSGHPSRVMRMMRDLVDSARTIGSSSAEEWQVEDSPSHIENAHSSLVEMEEELETIPDAGGLEEPEIPPPSFSLDEIQSPPEPMVRTEETVVSRPRGPLPSGMFGSLARRNRSSMDESPPFDPRLENEVPDETSPSMQGDEFDLWVMDESSLIEPEPAPDPLPAITPPQFETQSPVSNPVPQESPYSGLADRLSRLMPRQPRWQSESMPLDVQRLRALTSHERRMLEVAAAREFSPSDEALRKVLAIKRPRMSQLANGLYRSGILAVRQQGRSRWFSLTNDARAQLTAWGIMEVVE